MRSSMPSGRALCARPGPPISAKAWRRSWSADSLISRATSASAGSLVAYDERHLLRGRRLAAHFHIAAFAPHAHQARDDDCADKRHYRQRNAVIVVHAIGYQRLDRGVARRQEISELINKAGEHSADRGWRQLIEVSRDDAKAALNQELHEERADAQVDRVV